MFLAFFTLLFVRHNAGDGWIDVVLSIRAKSLDPSTSIVHHLCDQLHAGGTKMPLPSQIFCWNAFFCVLLIFATSFLQPGSPSTSADTALIQRFGLKKRGPALSHEPTRLQNEASDFLVKRGTGYNFLSADDLVAMKGLTWFYNWGTGLSPEVINFAMSHGIEFVPMQWGAWSIDQLEASIQQFPPGMLKNLLGFNEPNNPSQVSNKDQMVLILS
jgi:Glycosyl hydrolase catalytic core